MNSIVDCLSLWVANVFVAATLGLSRTRVHKLIEEGRVLLDGRAAYDGRREQGGELVRAHRPRAPHRQPPRRTRASRRRAVGDYRYVDVLPLPAGGHRIWYEARLPDQSHELRTELIPE